MLGNYQNLYFNTTTLSELQARKLTCFILGSMTFSGIFNSRKVSTAIYIRPRSLKEANSDLLKCQCQLEILLRLGRELLLHGYWKTWIISNLKHVFTYFVSLWGILRRIYHRKVLRDKEKNVLCGTAGRHYSRRGLFQLWMPAWKHNTSPGRDKPSKKKLERFTLISHHNTLYLLPLPFYSRPLCLQVPVKTNQKLVFVWSFRRCVSKQ